MDEEKAVAQIEACRHSNADGSKVTYDLSTGVDFSSGRTVADAIARTLWERDLKSFWIQNGNAMSFHPKYDIEVHLPHDLGDRAQKTVEKIQKDLEDVEMWNDLNSYLYSTSHQGVGLGSVLIMGPIWAYALAAHADKVREKEKLAELYQEMSSHISITE